MIKYLTNVILNLYPCLPAGEVKHLMTSSSYKGEILRLTPQNDIATQPLDGREFTRDGREFTRLDDTFI